MNASPPATPTSDHRRESRWYPATIHAPGAGEPVPRVAISSRLRIAAGAFHFFGWMGVLYVVLLLAAAAWEGHHFLQSLLDRPLLALGLVLNPVAFLVVGRDLDRRRRRGAYGAFAIMLIYPLTTPLGAQDWIGNLISVALASFIVSAWRELE